MNETVQVMTGYQLHENPLAVRQGIRILVEMERIRDEFVNETGLNFAIARTPAESTAQNFAIKDLLKFNGEAKKYVRGNVTNWKKIYESRGRTAVPVYYTNGFMVNHGARITLPEKLTIEEIPFIMLSGGNICNIFLGEKYPDVDALYELTKKIAMDTNIGYWSYTRDLTLCNSCFKTEGGIHKRCTFCGSSKVQSYSRITGYYQAVAGWNSGKNQELDDRFRFKV